MPLPAPSSFETMPSKCFNDALDTAEEEPPSTSPDVRSEPYILDALEPANYEDILNRSEYALIITRWEPPSNPTEVTDDPLIIPELPKTVSQIQELEETSCKEFELVSVAKTIPKLIKIRSLISKCTNADAEEVDSVRRFPSSI